MKNKNIEHLLKNNRFCALAIDQGTSLKNLIKNKKKNFLTEDYFNFKKYIISNLSNHVSSILFDYDTYIHDSIYKNLETQKIIAYEDDAYNIENLEKITKLPTKNFDHLLNNFGALKFFMYYNPDSNRSINEKKKLLIIKVSEICKNYNLPFLFEPLLYFDDSLGYNIEEFYKRKPQHVSYFYKEFSKLKYSIDIIKIEFPFNEFEVKGFDNDNSYNWYSFKDCEKLLKDTFMDFSTPFVFLSAGMNFNNFYKSLSLAKSSGINFLGFLCGRSIWYDAIDIFANSDQEMFINWIKNEGKNRITKLISVI